MDFTKLFCDCDDFIKLNYSFMTKQIGDNSKRKYTPRACKLSSSEVMAICIAFDQSGYRNFKTFYLNYVIKYLSGEFPSLVSYCRFVVYPINLKMHSLDFGSCH